MLAPHVAEAQRDARGLGLPAAAHYDDQWRKADRFIAFTAEPYEYPRRDWPASVRLVGPGTWEPPAEPPAWLAAETRPIVLVTASTAYQADERLIATALEAFAGEDVALVATTAANDPASFARAAERARRAFLPHGPIIARAACVVSHGGQGTTQSALAAGVPVCVVPFCRDQFDVARRVEVADAGVRLHHKRLSAARLRAAVQEARASGPAPSASRGRSRRRAGRARRRTSSRSSCPPPPRTASPGTKADCTDPLPWGSMRRMLVPLLVLAATGAVVPTPASAGTVEVVIERVPFPDFEGFLTRQARYVAEPGERNRVVVSSTRDGVRIADPGKRLRPVGKDCVSVAADAVECTWDRSMPPDVQAGLITASVRTLDGDDTMRVDEARPAQLFGDGGTGSDVLRGSDVMGDRLDGGGGGRDRLYGGRNADTLFDGDTTGDVDSDVLDAGPDGGSLSYQGRAGDVTVDLLRRRAGERGESDVLGPNLRAVYGGDGDDTLRGDGTFNHLEGGPGDDHLDGEGNGDFIRGGPGDDRLHGHAGRDYLDGGPGADQLRGDADDDDLHTPDARDRLACGPDDDVVSFPRQMLLVPRECERVRFGLDADPWPEEGIIVTTAAHPTSVAGGVATFGVTCPDDGYDYEACDGASTGHAAAARGPVRPHDRRRRACAGPSTGPARATTWSPTRGCDSAPRPGEARRARVGVLTGVTLRVAGRDPVRWAIRLRAG